MNARAIKAKGREMENAVVEYLRAHGFPHAERRRLSGVEDCGDIGGVPFTVLECKNEKRISLAGYMDELEREKANAAKEFGGVKLAAALVKKRGSRDAGDFYAVMPLRDLIPLIQAAAGSGPRSQT